MVMATIATGSFWCSSSPGAQTSASRTVRPETSLTEGARSIEPIELIERPASTAIASTTSGSARTDSCAATPRISGTGAQDEAREPRCPDQPERAERDRHAPRSRLADERDQRERGVNAPA